MALIGIKDPTLFPALAFGHGTKTSIVPRPNGGQHKYGKSKTLVVNESYEVDTSQGPMLATWPGATDGALRPCPGLVLDRECVGSGLGGHLVSSRPQATGLAARRQAGKQTGGGGQRVAAN